MSLLQRIKGYFGHRAWRKRGEQSISAEQFLAIKSIPHKNDRSLFHRMSTGPHPWDDPNWERRQRERKAIIELSRLRGRLG